VTLLYCWSLWTPSWTQRVSKRRFSEFSGDMSECSPGKGWLNEFGG
jgi:hypothetical protein